MTISFYRNLFDYNYWARDRFFEVLGHLDPQQFILDLGDGVGSIRDKLTHIFAAEKIWLERLTGSPEPFMTPDRVGDLPALQELWSRTEQAWVSFLDAQTNETLKDSFRYHDLKGDEHHSKLWSILTHVTNHGTYHRGQAASLVRRLTGKLPVTDYIAFSRL
ncbi:MAG: DinB family protein [Spirochaetales bacterium]|nr:DinB family protein [Spirochaetales bacterium]